MALFKFAEKQTVHRKDFFIYDTNLLLTIVIGFCLQ